MLKIPLRRMAAPMMVAGVAGLDRLMTSSSTKTKTESTTTSSNSKTGAKLLFIGTGSSTGCPKPLCSMLFGPHVEEENPTSNSELSRLRQEYETRCPTSTVATMGNPKTNKNYRNNPALVISHCTCTNEDPKNIIIDVGKTFREGALRWFPEHCITSLDAILLTHHHMDAAGGLDDVRGFQKMTQRGTYHKAPRMIPMPLHLSQFCLDDVAQRFPWLFPQQQPSYKTGMGNKPAVERHVASFDVQVFQDYQPMTVAGLSMVPLPVWHGDDLISYGFAFTLKDKHVVYISDISKMVPETLEYILTHLPRTDILIVDSLLPDRPHSVHFSMEQAIDLANQLQAKQTYLIGMNCDAFPLHDQQNEILQKQTGGRVQLAYDGQVIDL